MQEYATLRDEVLGSDASTVYSNLMGKEDKVLDLIGRMDETHRMEVLGRSEQRVSQFARAFVDGISTFVHRVMYYAAQGSFENVASLLTSPDGLVYTGVFVIAITLMVTVAGVTH